MTQPDNYTWLIKTKDTRYLAALAAVPVPGSCQFSADWVTEAYWNSNDKKWEPIDKECVYPAVTFMGYAELFVLQDPIPHGRDINNKVPNAPDDDSSGYDAYGGYYGGPYFP